MELAVHGMAVGVETRKMGLKTVRVRGLSGSVATSNDDGIVADRGRVEDVLVGDARGELCVFKDVLVWVTVPDKVVSIHVETDWRSVGGAGVEGVLVGKVVLLGGVGPDVDRNVLSVDLEGL